VDALRFELGKLDGPDDRNRYAELTRGSSTWLNLLGWCWWSVAVETWKW